MRRTHDDVCLVDMCDYLQWGGTYFRGIGLVKVLWKAIYGIINLRISSSIEFHDDLHKFCARRGTYTATLEENLLQQRISTRETFLHIIFIDLQKAYNALYMEHYMDILVGYGVGPRTLHILRTYWSQIQMAEKAGGTTGQHYRSTVGSLRGTPCHPQSLMWLLALSSDTG